MRMTRDDLAEMMRANQRKAVVREVTSEELDRQVQEYLSKGGKIKEVDIGVCSFTPDRFGGDQQSRAGKAYSEARRQSAEVGITAAAKELGIDHKTITRAIERGEGPPYRSMSDNPRSPKLFNLYALKEWGVAKGYLRER